MATWTDVNDVVWHFDDGKLNFDDWVRETDERWAAWEEGMIEHGAWKDANPTKPDSDNAPSKCGTLSQEWIDYCNAIQDFNLIAKAK